jgi:hypothetical protein
LFGVRIAINFNAQFGFGAIEVDDETTACPAVSGINRMLAAEFQAVELPIAQM